MSPKPAKTAPPPAPAQGGSYTQDPLTGALTRVASTTPAAVEPAAAPEPVGPAAKAGKETSK